jgi:hypothetical protein
MFRKFMWYVSAHFKKKSLIFVCVLKWYIFPRLVYKLYGYYYPLLYILSHFIVYIPVFCVVHLEDIFHVVTLISVNVIYIRERER